MKTKLFYGLLLSVMGLVAMPVMAQEEYGYKAAALGLHTAYTPNGAPYYTEAEMVIECKTMYAAPFDPKYFKSEVPRNRYKNFSAGIHSMYIGEVTNAWKKQ